MALPAGATPHSPQRAVAAAAQNPAHLRSRPARHYSVGMPGQRIVTPLKRPLPQRLFEWALRRALNLGWSWRHGRKRRTGRQVEM